MSISLFALVMVVICPMTLIFCFFLLLDIRLKESDIMDEDSNLKGVPDYEYQRACVKDVITGLNVRMISC